MGHAGDTSHWHNTPVQKQTAAQSFERLRRAKYAGEKPERSWRGARCRPALLRPPLHLLCQSERRATPQRVIVIGRGEQEPPLPGWVQLTSKRLRRVLNSEPVTSKKTTRAPGQHRATNTHWLRSSRQEMFCTSSHVLYCACIVWRHALCVK